MKISDSFLFHFDNRVSKSLLPINFGNPEYCAKVEKEILDKFDSDLGKPSHTDLDELYVRLQRGNASSFSQKEKKWLPWILYFGEYPQFIENPTQTKDILKLLNNPFRISFLRGLIHAYLENYDPGQGGCDLVRRFIWDKFESLSDEKIVPSIRFWKERKTPVFLPNGHHQTANIFLREKGEIHQTLLDYGFDNDLSSSKFIKFVSTSMIDAIVKNFPSHIEKCLSINETAAHPPSPKFKDLIVKMASTFLSKAGIDIEVPIKEGLSSYFLRHLNDPRIPGNDIYWEGVDEKSKKIFCQWLSSKDLEFFFNIVDEVSTDTKWKYRRKFWEAYLPYIENTWVILGRRAKEIAEQVDSSHLNLDLNRYGLLTGGDSIQSAFLIQMRGYIFVEWNNSGACRVWNYKKCPFKFSKESYSSDELRGPNFEDRFHHRSPEKYKWQDEMRGWIRDNTTIFVESYEYRLPGNDFDPYQNL
ncbi:hypothetical protein UR09_05135 [Candidatus Nitromaritima sp. SCGC AAA799-A02]|nr:hypothetical protein UR09_05135 [Candidatus Nitromaritima sp. SCGC AAA799-A02]